MNSLLALVVVTLSIVTLASARCTGSRLSRSCDEDYIEENCVECTPTCDCSAEDCSECQGTSKCCQSCCDTRVCTSSKCEEEHCQCSKISCSSCSSIQSDCCSSCCNCRPKKCSVSSCGCSSINCGSCRGSCCNSCCNSSTSVSSTSKPSPERIIQMPNITLPNITVIINQSPIYVNTTPLVNNYQSCGNFSSVNNGTHVIYISSNSSNPGCQNRTCCRLPSRPPCMPMPVPPFMNCPPVRYSWGCGAGCQNSLAPPPPAPCFNNPSYPYSYGGSSRCPMAGCSGFGCQQGGFDNPCFRIPGWPYFRCIPGNMGLTYGGPDFSVNYAGASAGPFSVVQSDLEPPSYPPSATHGGGGYGFS